MFEATFLTYVIGYILIGVLVGVVFVVVLEDEGALASSAVFFWPIWLVFGIYLLLNTAWGKLKSTISGKD